MAAIRLERLSKVHPDGSVAVDAVDLDIGDGELFVLLGPSGCGKTSLLRMIAGLDEPTAGDILLDERSLRTVGTRDRQVGMLFQSSAVYPHLTVRENLAFPLVVTNAGRHTIATRVAEMAELVGLSHVLDVRPRRLSGGMQQRVAMGRALMRRPPLLLMDEPMSNLDAKLRTELRGQIAAIQRWSGATTVYVTHDQVEAMALADRAAVMRRGTVVQCGSADELYRRPVDLFVATFVGTPPMNVVVARLDRDDRRLVAEVGPHRVVLGDPARWPDVARFAGREIGLGIRPPSLAIASEPGPTTLPVEVVRVEHLGAERLVTAALEARAVTVNDVPDIDPGMDPGIAVDPGPVTSIGALVDADVAVDLWRPVHLRIDVAEVHLFDLATGRRLPDAAAGQRGTRSVTAAGSTA